MLKIQKAIALILCFSGFSQGHAQIKSFKGFYSGINVGDSLTTTKYNLQSNGLSAFPLTGFALSSMANTSHVALNKNALQGGIIAGYGQNWNCFYVGLEGFVDVFDNKMQSLKNTGGYLQSGFEELTTNNLLNFKVNSPIYGIALRPGILLKSSTLLFINVGVGFSQISSCLTNSTQDRLLPDSNPNNLFKSDSLFSENLISKINAEHHKAVHFLRIGAGLEGKISDQLSLRLEYIYANLGSMSENVDKATHLTSQNFGDGVVSTHSIVDSIIKNSTVKLGLSYYCPTFENKQTCKKVQPISLCKSLYFGGSAGGMFSYPSQYICANNQNYFPSTLYGAQEQNFFFEQTGSFHKDSLIGSLFIGKGYNLCPFYFGSEVFLNFNRANMTSYGSGGTNGYLIAGNVLQETFISQSDVCISPSLLQGGIDVRPGLFINNTLLYARVGVSVRSVNIHNTNYATSDYLDPAQFPPNSIFPVVAHNEQNKTLTGLRLGLGLEKMISEKIALRAEFINTQYPRVALAASNDRSVPNFNQYIGPGTITATHHLKTKLRDNTVLLGISYYL